MNWYTQKPAYGTNSRRNLELLQHSLDEKYGNYNYREDLRSADNDKQFSEIFQTLVDEKVNPYQKPKILIVGANSGYEIPFVKDKGDITAVDLSREALTKLATTYPNVTTKVADIIALPFADNSFDLVIAMRVIHASNVDSTSALREILRVTKHSLIVSIANGYYVDSKVQKGMYNYVSKKIETTLPYQYQETLTDVLIDQGMQVAINEIPSEIIISATHKKDYEETI